MRKILLFLFTFMLCVTQVMAEFTPDPGKTYYIKSPSGTYILARPSGSSNPGAYYRESVATAFKITKNDNTYTIQNTSDNAYLYYYTANDWNTQMSTAENLSDWSKDWVITDAGNGTYTIARSNATTNYLRNNNTNDNEGVYTGTINAVNYTFVEVTNKTLVANKLYRLKHKKSGLYLCLTNPGNTDASLCSSENAPVFYVEKQSTGYSIKEVSSTKYLGVSSNGLAALKYDTPQEWYVDFCPADGDFIIKKQSGNADKIYFGTDITTPIVGTGLYCDVTNPVVWTLEEHIDPSTTPQAISDFLDRIGGSGASALFEAELRNELAEGGKDVFVITSKNGKPCVKGSSLSAITAGIGYYLNHYAKVNLSWNNLTTNLSTATLPVPTSEDKHVCTADYRYYLNYCTYSYSMSVWDETRWMQEIDWMALHGINMPLAVVGMEAVWKKLLTTLGHSGALNDFVPGPSYQAWWLMGNLQGMGGPNPDWWYVHQETLGKNILSRMRALGMEPVLPGFAGQVPTSIAGSLGAVGNGSWCSFTSPALVKPGTSFTDVAAKYYAALEEVMGTSKFYSMDLFHETGSAPAGIDAKQMYESVESALNTYKSDAKWLIQQWQWSGTQGNSCSWVSQDKLVVLDLWSEVKQGWTNTYGGGKNFNGREMIYCMLHNFGGRTGIYGRLSQTINGYNTARNVSGLKLKGVGATPEGIETNPILYDALYEMPWTTISNVNAWVADWVEARYGTDNAEAKAAWALLTEEDGILNCPTVQQGVSEPILCARPGLEIPSASAWSTSTIYYDTQKVIKATELLLNQKNALSGANYGYDLVDAARQILTDQAQPLLAEIKKAHETGNTAEFARLTNRFYSLIEDIDRLLSTDVNFMLGRWTQLARRNAGNNVAPSWSNPNYADAGYNAGFTSGADWTEWNARKLITTWGYSAQCTRGRLRDYSQREWAGLMKDFYLPRWKKFFTQLAAGTTIGREDASWYTDEDVWTRNYSNQYSDTPTGNSATIAAELFPKYFGKFATSSGEYFINQGFASSNLDLIDNAFRNEKYTPSLVSSATISKIAIDLNGDGTISQSETVEATSYSVPTTAATGKVKAILTLNDGTEFTYTILLKDNVTEARTIAVVKPTAAEGTVTLTAGDGVDVTDADGKLSATTTNDVTITATPSSTYDFVKWTKGGEDFGTANPYIYTAKDAAELTPIFAANPWANVPTNMVDYSTVKSNSQYASVINYTPNAGEATQIYYAEACPAGLYNVVPTAISAARGAAFSLDWKSGGLNYTRLSAYIDLNHDGDFDDEGEFVGTIGELEQQNANVKNGSMNFLLPYNAELGLTHIRLRFDGAWETDNMNAHGAKEPYATTTRMVYDVKLNITEYATTTTTIAAIANDASMGTIRVTGGEIDNQNPAVIIEGKSITLEATPNDGYTFLYWMDEFDREMSREASYTFRPAGSCTYTAVFESSEDAYFAKGDGTVHSFAINDYFPWNALKKDKEWTITMEVESDGSSFNEYGSVAIADGTQATKGHQFQLYMTKDGSLNLNLSGTEVTGISSKTNYTAKLTYRDGRLYLYAKGKDSQGNAVEYGANNSKYFTIPINDFTHLSYALPTGVNIKSLNITSAEDQQYATDPKNLAQGDPYVTGNGNVQLLKAKYYITNVDSEQKTKYNVVPKGKSWQMVIDVKNTGNKTFNQWGSCILASSQNAVDVYYWNDFQVYQHANDARHNGTLNFKSNKADGNDHIIAQGQTVQGTGKDYKVTVRYDGGNVYVIRTTIDINGDGTPENYDNVWIASRVQNDIDVMSCALPEGINIKDLKISIAEECGLLEGADYAIQNIGNKHYISFGDDHTFQHYRTADHASKFQIQYTGNRDLAYHDADGGLHETIFLIVEVYNTQTSKVEKKYLGPKGNDGKWTLLDFDEGHKSQAQPFLYSPNSKWIQDVVNTGTGDNVQSSLGDEWTIEGNKQWFFDFFATFQVDIRKNGAVVTGDDVTGFGGFKYKTHTSSHGKFIDFPANADYNAYPNKSEVGYWAPVTKDATMLRASYEELENTFYHIAHLDRNIDTLYYWYKDREVSSVATPSLITYHTTNSLSGLTQAWGERGNFAEYTIAKATEIPMKLSKVGEKYYNTVYCPNALTLPDGVTAFRLNEVKDRKFKMKEIELADHVLPAKTAAVLISDAKVSATKWTVSTSSPTAITEDNLFMGVLEQTANAGNGQTTSSNTYVLGNKSGIGFYPYSAAKIPAFKVYYEAPAQQSIQMFSFLFDDDETPVTEIEKDEANGDDTVIYDLMGRRTSAINKSGIYIVNGKKVLVK